MFQSGGVMERLAELASEQWGLITARQAAQLGVPVQSVARLADRGLLERYRHGVYRVGGAPSDPLMDLRAAWLSLAPARTARDRLDDPGDGLVSHRSAAQLHQLGDLDAPRMEFITTMRKQTRDPALRLHRRTAAPADWTIVDGLPVTSVPGTIGDLARAGIDGGHLAGVVASAVTGGLVNVDELAHLLAPVAHRYGVARGQGRQLVEELVTQDGMTASTRALMQLFADREARLAAARGDSLQRTVAVLQGRVPEPLPVPPLLKLLEHQTTSHENGPAGDRDPVAHEAAP